MKLWLDDIRPAPEGWEWYTNPWDALAFVLKSDAVDEWSLDHDLGDGVPSGYDFVCMVEALVRNGCRLRVPSEIRIHSANPPGRENMERALDSIRRWLIKSC